MFKKTKIKDIYISKYASGKIHIKIKKRVIGNIFKPKFNFK